MLQLLWKAQANRSLAPRLRQSITQQPCPPEILKTYKLIPARLCMLPDNTHAPLTVAIACKFFNIP